MAGFQPSDQDSYAGPPAALDPTNHDVEQDEIGRVELVESSEFRLPCSCCNLQCQMSLHRYPYVASGLSFRSKLKLHMSQRTQPRSIDPSDEIDFRRSPSKHLIDWSLQTV